MSEYAPGAELSGEFTLSGAPRALPFSIKVLVWFFLFDALDKLRLLAMTYGMGYELWDGGSFVDRYLPHVLVLTFDLLLALEVWRRTQAGRIWAMIYLAAITLLALFVLVVEPQQWTDMTGADRVRTLLSQGLHLFFFGVLLSRRTGRILSR